MKLRSCPPRLASQAIAVALLLLCSRAVAETDGDWSFSYSGSTATITGYSGSSTVVTVPSTVTRTEEYQEQDDDGDWHTRHRTYTYTVTAIGSGVFKNKTSLTGATIPSSVISIGSELFYGCTSLRSVMANGSIKTIPSYCFYGCSSLSTFSIPSSVTSIESSAFLGCRNWSPPSSFSGSLKSIGSSAFSGCVKFRTVALGPNVTSLGYSAFYGCDQITGVTVDCPVTLPAHLFGNCSNLVSVVIGNHVTGLGKVDGTSVNGSETHPFCYCPNIRFVQIGNGVKEIPKYWFGNYHGSFPANSTIERIELPNTVSSIGDYAFSGCRNADFGQLSFPNIKSIGNYAFSGCRNLEPFVFPDSLTSIGACAFLDCVKFRTVMLGPNVTSLGSSAFYGCDQITSVTVDCPVTLPAHLFGNCSNLVSVVIGDNVQDLGKTITHGTYSRWTSHPFRDCPKIKSFVVGRGIVTIPEYYFGNHSDGGYCFPAFSSLEHITLPDTITTIEQSAFSGCRNADFGQLSLPDLTSVGASAFSGCRNLEPFDFPDSLTSIGSSAFSGCVKFRTVTLGPNVTSLGALAFYGCDQITSVTVDSPVTLPDQLFEDCSNIVSVVIGDNVQDLGKTITHGTYSRWTSHPFRDCPKIKSFVVGRGIVTIPEYYFGNHSDGGYCFPAFSSLEHITLPDTITTIEQSAFSGCRNADFGQLSLPDLTSVGASAFSGCRNLEPFDFPDSLKSIGSSAFSGCVKFRTVTIGPNVTSLGTSAFYGCDQLTNATVNCPGSLPNTLFGNCSNLLAVVIGDNISDLGSSKDRHPFYRCPKIKTFHSGNGITTIPDYYFNNYNGNTFTANTTLEHIELPNTITSIGQSAFSGCRNTDFGQLSLPNLAIIGVSAFSGCRKLEPFDFPDSLKSIGSSAFSGCVKFRTVTIGPNVTSLGTSAFYGCDQLTNATVNCPRSLPNTLFGNCSNLLTVVIGDNISDLGSSKDRHPFYRCPKIKTFHVGNGITTIPDYYFYNYNGNTFTASSTIKRIELPDTIETIGQSAFNGCRSLTEFSIPASVTSIGNSAFSDCSGAFIGELELGPQITSLGSSAFRNCLSISSVAFDCSMSVVPSSCFSGCSGMASMTLGEQIQTIGNSSFSGCSGITNATIPKTVARIDSYAFENCLSLTNVWLEGVPPTTGSYVFRNVAPGARGYYPRSLSSEWLPQIDRNGKWNGLIMHELSQPVLRVKSARPAEGSITLAWDDGTDGQCVSSYAIYRGPGPERLPEYFVEGGISDTEWTDHGYWNAEPVLLPLNYWVVAGSDYFDLPESNRVETRHRYGLSVGFDKYGTLNRGLRQSLADATLFSNLVSRGKAERVDLIKNEGAKRSDIHDAFIRWSTIVKPGDTFFFFIATHGGYNGAAAWLSAYDGTYSVSQLVSDSSLISSEASFAGVIMSCQSRALVDSTDDTNFTFKVRSGLAQCRPNSAWIASCGYDESSFNTPTSRQTLFGEWFLEEGWQNGYADTELYGMEYGGVHSDGSLTLLELARYARAFAKGLSDAKPSTVFWNEESEPVMSRLVLDTTCSPAELSPPTAPTGLTAERHALRSIALSWNAVQGAKLYRVHRNPVGEPNEWTCIRNQCPSPSYIDDTGLALSQSYFYRLQAVNPVGVSEMSAPAFGSAGALDFLGFLAAGAPDIVSASTPTPDQYETAAASVGLNGVSLEYSFIAGLDPKDPNARFESRIDMVDGKPVVTPSPNLGTNRVYTVEGKSSLSDETWGVPDENSRFFRVKVRMPE